MWKAAGAEVPFTAAGFPIPLSAIPRSSALEAK